MSNYRHTTPDELVRAFDQRAPGFAALYGQRGQLERQQWSPRGPVWKPLLAGTVTLCWLERRLPPTGRLRVVPA